MKIAILGAGVVGGGLLEVLLKNRSIITKRAGREIDVAHILCRKKRAEHPRPELLCFDFEEIIADREVELVVECMGGLRPAYDYVSRSLKSGKAVVTSNKELVAEKGRELCDIARRNGVNFMFEAAVGGGIPIIRPIGQCLAANEISSVSGILNGTTNYILTEMIRYGKSFDQALSEAQQKGFAEADPTADIKGIDAGRKVCILADLCFGKEVRPENVFMQGIDGISSVDIDLARTLGYRIKLLGRAMRTGPNNVTAFVAPHLISKSSPLASVDGVQNAVLIKGDAVGEVFMMGPGAGALPTASAVAADVIDCVRDPSPRVYMGFWPSEPGYVTPPSRISSRFMVRAGQKLAEIGEAFSDIRFITAGSAPSDEFAFVTGYMTEEDLLKKTENIGLKTYYRLLD